MADTLASWPAFVPPVSVDRFTPLAAGMVLAGVATTMQFFTVQTLSSSSRGVAIEVALGLASAVLLGGGLTFALLANGVWI